MYADHRTYILLADSGDSDPIKTIEVWQCNMARMERIRANVGLALSACRTIEKDVRW